MNRSSVSLPRSTPSAQGVRAGGITDFLAAVASAKLELHSFMMVRHGHVVAQGWWHPYAQPRPHMLFSLSKSFTSTAVGMAIAQGCLTLEDQVLSFFPDEAPAKPSPHLAAMRVRDLLTMSTGHAVEPALRGDGSEQNWVRAFLEAPVEYQPGTHFVYNSGATYMLSAIVQKVTGQDLLTYLQPRLFAPLGIVDPTWERSPQGICAGGWGLSITTEDIAKFGQLYLQEGKWQGEQLIAPEWVKEATAKQIANDLGKSDEERMTSDWAQGYGYQFWRCRQEAYRGDGAFGQFCIVLPSQDAVVALTSGVRDMQAVLQCVWSHLLPACGASADERDDAADRALAAGTAQLSMAPPMHHLTSDLEAVISERTYVMAPSADGGSAVQALALAFAPDHITLAVTDDRGQHVVQCGRTSWLEGKTTLARRPGEMAVAASATWQDEHTCVITCCFVETPFTSTFVCSFAGDEVTLRESINVSFGDTDQPVQHGHYAG